MARWLITSILLLVLHGSTFAIDASVAHNVFFKVAGSEAGKASPGVDIYWQVNPRTLHFQTTADKMIVASMKTDIVFTNEAGTVAEDHFIVKTNPKSNPDDLALLSVFELRNYSLVTGIIKVSLRLTDLADTTNRFVYTDTFTVTSPASEPFYSGVQLLDTAITASVKTQFTRNGKQQLPLCANFLDEHKSIMHYYGELYNTSAIAASDFPLVQRVTIGRKEQEFAINNFLKVDTITKAGKIIAVSGSFVVNTLGSGNYYVNISLENSAHKVIARRSLFFQRLNTHPVKEDVTKKEAVSDTGMEKVTYFDLDKTFLVKYNLQQIRSILKMMIPVSDPMAVSTINNFLKKPDEMYMRYFIYNYFVAINKKDPGKAWKEYSEKVIDVNKKFNFQSTPGYETDRGIIYLRYGAPTDIITVNNETGTLPYEIWQYNTLLQTNQKSIANALFLFYKADQMLGDYRLLHSTVTGEVVNMQWRTYLYTNGNTGVNTSTRAEDFIGSK